jgi:hypothetical protein
MPPRHGFSAEYYCRRSPNLSHSRPCSTIRCTCYAVNHNQALGVCAVAGPWRATVEPGAGKVLPLASGSGVGSRASLGPRCRAFIPLRRLSESPLRRPARRGGGPQGYKVQEDSLTTPPDRSTSRRRVHRGNAAGHGDGGTASAAGSLNPRSCSGRPRHYASSSAQPWGSTSP